MTTISRNDNVNSTQFLRTRPSWHIKTVFENLDFFAEAVPSFNLTGQGQVGTFLGGLISFVILIITLAYANLNLIELINAG